MKNLITALLILTGMTATGSTYAEPVKLTMIKQTGCKCCDKHARLLEQQGYAVEIQSHDKLSWLKAELGIPRELAGCHTMLVGDYIVEGHVPGSIINRLLAEKPDIRGVALPGMPKGTPGMPGERNQLLDVYVLEAGQKTVFDRF